MGSDRDLDDRVGIRELLAEILSLHDPSKYSSSIPNKSTQGYDSEAISTRASLLSGLEYTGRDASQGDVNIATESPIPESRNGTTSTSLRSPRISGLTPMGTTALSQQTVEKLHRDPATPIKAQSIEKHDNESDCRAAQMQETRRIPWLNWNVCDQPPKSMLV